VIALSQASAEPEAQSSATPELAEKGKLSVLLVEDEPYALEALVEMLEDQGLHVKGCSNASEGRAALAEGAFDLLLTDIVLPGDSGLLLAAEACDHDPNLTVIVMSGYVPKNESMRPEWLFLRKPINSALLKDLIQAALQVRA
jgi:DNA-binding NtrC family response regulator